MLLDALGDPHQQYPSIHVVGTNGKSTATRTIEAHLAATGLNVGAYLSPHVRGWSERIRSGGEEADFERAVGRVREAAVAVGATQFEVLTAAAFAEFAADDVDAAVIEAGLGGRYDATNVLDAPVVLLTNVGLDHVEVLGETREAIARREARRRRSRRDRRPAGRRVRPPRPGQGGSARWRARGRRRVPRRRGRGSGGGPAAGSARASLRLGDLGRRAQPGRARLGAPTPAGRELHRRRLDPPRQGRGGDARAPRASRPALRRDDVVEPPGTRPRASSPPWPLGGSPRSRPSTTRSPRSSARGRIPRCS